MFENPWKLFRQTRCWIEIFNLKAQCHRIWAERSLYQTKTKQRQVLWNFTEPTIRRHEFSQRKEKHITGIITKINKRLVTPVSSLFFSSVKDTADWEIFCAPLRDKFFRKFMPENSEDSMRVEASPAVHIRCIIFEQPFVRDDLWRKVDLGT